MLFGVSLRQCVTCGVATSKVQYVLLIYLLYSFFLQLGLRAKDACRFITSRYGAKRLGYYQLVKYNNYINTWSVRPALRFASYHMNGGVVDGSASAQRFRVDHGKGAYSQDFT